MTSLSVAFRSGLDDQPALAGLGSLLASCPDPRKLMPYLRVAGGSWLLEQANTGGLLEWRTEHLRAVPIGFGCPLPDFERPCTEVTLSRFALLRREGGEWRLESGRSRWSIELSPVTAARLMAGSPSADEAALLAALGMFADADDEAWHWQFHERYFALRSRQVFALSPPRRATQPPPAVVRSRFPGAPRVPLATGDSSPTGGPAHFAVTESRRTHRSFKPVPVTQEQLGRLLWHTLRNVSEEERDEADHTTYDAFRRPVPSGGGMHAIDAWIFTHQVEGLPEQWWWYDPFEHELVAVPVTGSPATPMTDSPIQVIFTVHHERVSWKYGALAHSLEHKDVGVIMHALQLASGALGMGAWPIGASDVDVAAAVLGLNPEVDVPLGELALGVVSDVDSATVI